MDEKIKYLEEISRLNLTEEQLDSLNTDGIREFMSKLNEIDTENVEIMTHPFNNNVVFREDVCEEFEDISLIMDNAPLCKDNFFVVPKTV